MPVAKRACTNDCGVGEQTCSVGAWSTCAVAVATRECRTICGSGQESCRDGKWADCSAPRPGPPKLKVIVRDFNDTHPDFERSGGSSAIDTAIVEKVLGSDDKPVYAGRPSTNSTTGKQFFDEWYRDTKGVNLSTTITLALSPSAANPNVFNYDNDAFFPIDGQLFGNQARPHNYDFTVELATQFRYVGERSFVSRATTTSSYSSIATWRSTWGAPTKPLRARSSRRAGHGARSRQRKHLPFHLFFAEHHVIRPRFTSRPASPNLLARDNRGAQSGES